MQHVDSHFIKCKSTATQNIISSITDNCLEIPKSTLINWSNETKENLMPEIENIEKEYMILLIIRDPKRCQNS